MDKKFATLISVFVFAVVLFLSLVAFNEPLKRFTSATEDFSASSDSSIVFAWPLTTSANGQEAIKIDVFARSSSGKPLSDKTVSVTSTLGTLKAINSKTDKSGKASFVLTSDSAGEAIVTAVIDGTTTLNKQLTLKFE